MSDRVNATVNNCDAAEIDDITERMDDVRERLKQLDEFLSNNAAENSNYNDSTINGTNNSEPHSFKSNTCDDDTHSDVCNTNSSINIISNNNSSKWNKFAYFRAQNASREHAGIANNSRQSEKQFGLRMPKRKVALQPPRRRFAMYSNIHVQNETFAPTSQHLQRQNVMPYSQSTSPDTSREEPSQQHQEEWKEIFECHSKQFLEEECIKGITNDEKKDDHIMTRDLNTKYDSTATSALATHSLEEKSVTTNKWLPANTEKEIHPHTCEHSEAECNIKDINSKAVQVTEVSKDNLECKENKPPLFLTRNLSGLYVDEQPFNLMEAVQKRIQRKQYSSITPLTQEQTKLSTLNEIFTNKNSNYSMSVDDNNNKEDSGEQSPESPVRDGSTETAAPENSPIEPLLQTESEENEEYLQYESNERAELCENELSCNSFNEECNNGEEEQLTSPLHGATIIVKVTLCELLSLLEKRRWVQTSASENISLFTHGVDNTNRVYTLLVTSKEHASLLLQRTAWHTKRTKFNHHEPTYHYRTESDDKRETESDTSADYFHYGKGVNSCRCSNIKTTLHRKKAKPIVPHSTRIDRHGGKEVRNRIPI